MVNLCNFGLSECNRVNLYNFCLSECNRVIYTILGFLSAIGLICAILGLSECNRVNLP